MTRTRLSALVGATMLALTAAARAADMPELPPVIKQPVHEYFSPWYLRVDGGYRMNMIKGGTIFGAPFTDRTLDDAFTIGAGIGMKWDWFRSDITVDYGTQKYEGFLVAGSPAVTAKLNSYTTLLNAYVDLGTWWGFTPYVGGGFGFSFLKPGAFTTVPAILVPIEKSGRYDFSWAGTFGAAYAISPGLLLDLNYRYLDLGKTNTNIPDVGTVTYGDWTAHEFRFGLRYLIQ
jgi:opacity protein-like surface antigen